jgi:NitT/TauT family transport system substrate-binding protein
VRVAFLTSGTIAAYYAAARQGYFAAHGLDVSEQVVETAPLIQAALDRGDVDIIFGVASAGLAARQGGRDMVTILQVEAARMSAPDSYPLLVKPTSTIKSLTDLKGKRIAVANTGAQIVANLMVLLKRAGISEKDVVLVQAPFATHLDLLNSDQVDATLTLEPFRTAIVKEGIGKEVLYPYIDAAPGQPLGTWWANRSWADAHPAQVEAFVAAEREAMDWLVANPPQARDLMSSITKIDPTLLNDMLLPNWDYTVDEQAWEKAIQVLVEAGTLDATMPVADILYRTALEN